MNRIAIASLAAFLYLTIQAPARAHLPITIGGADTSPENAFQIEDTGLSQVAYHKRTAAQPELWITFQAEANTPLFLQMGVPKVNRLSTYRPAMALVGPGLPQADTPFELPDGYGALLFPTESEPANEFFEPFTGTTSWQFAEHDLILYEPGVYYVVGYSPANEDGKFWLAIGKREEFSLADILSLPAIVFKVRLFHEVFPIGGIAMGAILILLFLLGLLFRLLWLPPCW